MSLAVGLQITDAQLVARASGGFERIPEQLDASGVGYIVVGGSRGRSAAGPTLDPTLVATVFARRTRGLGLVAAASPQRDHPYNIARRFASLDHIAGGRSGWLALRTDHAIALGAPRRGTWSRSAAPLGAELLADAATAARALWRTWPIETLTRPTEPRTPDLEVRYADHTGTFPTTGPLNVPTTPQGEPIVFWDYGPGDIAHLGVADIAVVTPRDLLAPLPPAVTAHVRLRADTARLRERLEDFAATPGVTGVLLHTDPTDVRDLLDRTLPSLADAGVIRLRDPDSPATPTLREQLGLPRRAEPDPLRFRPVYTPV